MPGDWSVYNPDLEPGGWAFEFANDWYPDVDDSAVILMVLRRIAVRGPRARRPRDRARHQLDARHAEPRRRLGARSTPTTTPHFLNEIPFADMKAMIDPPTEDLTGRAARADGQLGLRPRLLARAPARATFLLRTQRADGSWWGRWGSNFIYGTWSVLPACARSARTSTRRTCGARSRGSSAHQNADGGWGETLASYDDETLAGRGAVDAVADRVGACSGCSPASATSAPRSCAGSRYLLGDAARRRRGTRTQFTGTGFPRHFYLRYTMYREYFPLMALGQVHAALAAAVTVPLSFETERVAVARAPSSERAAAAPA